METNQERVKSSLNLCVFWTAEIWKPDRGIELICLDTGFTLDLFLLDCDWGLGEGCSPLRRPRCRCTSSSQDTCWPGTIGKFYTAASSSAPSCPTHRRYQYPSPGTRTHTQKKCVWSIMACGEVQQIMGIRRTRFSHLLWIWKAESLIFLTLLVLYTVKLWDRITLITTRTLM